jgi:ornithine cyclodeaminase
MEKKKVGFVYLSEPDMIRAGVLNIKKCVKTMDETFHLLGEGDYVMGGPSGNEHGSMLWYPEKSEFPNMPLAGPDRRYMAMPAYLGGRFNICGVKWYGSNVVNPGRGYPRSILMFCLNDADTGEPKAIMSANLLSAMRTGSVPGVATKYLARKGAETVGIVGCGVISRACARAILFNMPNFRTMYLYDIVRENAEKFAKEIMEDHDIEIIITDSLRDSIINADVISVAAAGPIAVRIEKDWLKPGCLLTSAGHIEMDDSCLLENKIVLDHWKMHKAWLDEGKMHEKGISTLTFAPTYQMLLLYYAGKIKEENILSLSDITVDKAKFERRDNDKFIFLTGGIPVEDVSWGYTIYEEALKLNIGQNLVLWDEPYWM